MIYKLPICCLIVNIYITFLYFYNDNKIEKSKSSLIFKGITITGLVYYIMEITTLYTVNHVDTVNLFLNKIIHMIFLLSIDFIIYLLFVYMMVITQMYPSSFKGKTIASLPFILNLIIAIMTINALEFRIGSETNYSMGTLVYTCYIMISIYIISSIVIYLRRWRYIKENKRMCIAICLGSVTCILLFQMIFPETLISSIAVILIILGIYTNMENQSLVKLEKNQVETVFAFANVIESRDGSTGEHIKRTTKYVELIANELKDKGYYKNILTNDYIDNLILSAPMHDIGKMSVPDSILQKKGKLTDEEYSKMKEHSTQGAKIIKMTLAKVEDSQYVDMAYNVALCHHEKWNGRGYPNGLSGEDIPLCARIMAVADVFDAVSQNRCYREAMSLDKSFSIIESGIGTDFDPIIAQIFLDARPKVEEIYKNL